MIYRLKLKRFSRLISTFIMVGLLLAVVGSVYAFDTDTDLSNADASFLGEDAGDWSGRSVAGAGDVNGDGLDDILIGTPNDEDGGNIAGQTYLILGRGAADWGMDYDLSNADASFLGEDADDWSGWSVAGAGDVNGDGLDDILIGAYQDNDGGNNAGQTYLVLGRGAANWGMDYDLSNADASFWGEDAGDESGYSVAGAGDVNGDGLDDILIGAYQDDDGGNGAGQTYLILGRGAANWGMDYDLSNADASFWGEDMGDWSGYSVAGAGDVNGDGLDDILIGAYLDDDGGWGAGQTYLILGRGAANWGMDYDLSDADASFWGEDEYDKSGRSVAGAGDVNGDGLGDILIGAFGNSDGGDYAGQTYLILGRGAANWGMDYDLSNADASFWGEDADDWSGWSVAGAGDVNGDGLDDILIGTPNDEDGGNYAGQTYLILGRGAANWGMDYDLSDADASFWGEDEEDFSGFSVAGAGDVNGDGLDDILIGAAWNDGGGNDAGQTYLLLGLLQEPPPTDIHTWPFCAAGFFPQHLPDSYTEQIVLANLDPGTIPGEVQGVYWYDCSALQWKFWAPGAPGTTLTTLGGGHTYDYMVSVTGDCDLDIPFPGTIPTPLPPPSGPHNWDFCSSGFFPSHLPDSYTEQIVLANLGTIPGEVQGVYWYDCNAIEWKFWAPGAPGTTLTTLGGGHTYDYMVSVTGSCDWEVPLP